jgi:hypothetical protein
MTNDFPAVVGICLDAEAIWVGNAPGNTDRAVLLSHGASAVQKGFAPLLDGLDAHGEGEVGIGTDVTVDCGADVFDPRRRALREGAGDHGRRSEPHPRHAAPRLERNPHPRHAGREPAAFPG